MTLRFWTTVALAAAVIMPAVAQSNPERYAFDIKGQHAFIEFRIQHLGYSWLYGRFNDFDGHFTYDEDDPSNNEVTVTIDTASVDTNHAERDKHLRGKDFLHVDKYPQARFVSTGYKKTGEGTAEVTGNLTLHGVTKKVTIDVQQVGAGEDPWGGFRRGFYGTTELRLADFDIDYDLGPAAQTVELKLSIEGVRQ